MNDRLMVGFMAGCVLLAAVLWRTRPEQRSKALFPLGLSAIMGSSVSKDRNVALSIALSVLAIVLLLASVWLQRIDKRS